MTAEIIAFAPRVAAAAVAALPSGATVVDHIEHWLTRRDEAVLRLGSALCPPVDAIGDEGYDVALARLFYDMVATDHTWLMRVQRLRTALDVTDAYVREMRVRAKTDADHAVIFRATRFMLRLSQWSLAIAGGDRHG